MKKLIIIFILLALGLPVYSNDNFYDMSIEEYSKYFEAGYDFDDEEKSDSEEFVPKEKEKIDLEGKDVIKLNNTPIELKINQNLNIEPYEETFIQKNGKNEMFKTERLTLFSDTSKELSNYMTKNLKTSVNAHYRLNDTFDLKAGHEIWYVNPNASLGAKKVYINPRLNLSDSFYLDFLESYNEKNKNVEQEFGVNYMPKLFNNNASFGVKAGSTTNQGQLQSKKVKFSTDLYIF